MPRPGAPPRAVALSRWAVPLMMGAAVAALGLATDLRALRTRGLQPLLLGLGSGLFIGVLIPNALYSDLFRHCEERSDAAIPGGKDRAGVPGLPRHKRTAMTARPRKGQREGPLV